MSDAPTLAKSLLKLRPQNPSYVNEVLDHLLEIDSGSRVYWNSLSDDKEVSHPISFISQICKTYRALLKALHLVEVEKKVLSSGAKIGLAFIKPPDEPELHEHIKRLFQDAFTELCQEQIAEIKAQRQADESALPVVVDMYQQNVRFGDDDDDDEVQKPRQPAASQAGLMTLEEYRARRDIMDEGVEHIAPTLVEEPVNILENRVNNNALLEKYQKAKRLQSELWGMSSSRQSKLRKQLGMD